MVNDVIEDRTEKGSVSIKWGARTGWVSWLSNHRLESFHLNSTDCVKSLIAYDGCPCGMCDPSESPSYKSDQTMILWPSSHHHQLFSKIDTYCCLGWSSSLRCCPWKTYCISLQHWFESVPLQFQHPLPLVSCHSSPLPYPINTKYVRSETAKFLKKKKNRKWLCSQHLPSSCNW